MKVRPVQQIHLRKRAIPPPTKQPPRPELTPVPGLHYKDEVLSATTSIFGLFEHTQKAVSKLPSSHGEDVKYEKGPTGLTNSTWSVDEEWFPFLVEKLPLVGLLATLSRLMAKLRRLSSTSAEQTHEGAGYTFTN